MRGLRHADGDAARLSVGRGDALIAMIATINARIVTGETASP